MPTDGEIPSVLDMATSEAAMGKIRMAEKAKARHSPDLGRHERRARRRPIRAEAIAGMLLPSGGAKGFGLPS